MVNNLEMCTFANLTNAILHKHIVAKAFHFCNKVVQFSQEIIAQIAITS